MFIASHVSGHRVIRSMPVRMLVSWHQFSRIQTGSWNSLEIDCYIDRSIDRYA